MKVDFVADIGNSAIKCGLVSRATRTVESQALGVLPLEDPAGWAKALREGKAGAWEVARMWALAGSNPRARDRFARWLTDQGETVIVIRDRSQIPIEVNVQQPECVGLDRLFNALAVKSKKSARASVIVDAGSAITVDLLDGKGVFQGGAILPGLAMMSRALHAGTALLPEVNIEGPVEAPGEFTEQAIAAGIFSAAAGGVERIIRRYQSQTPQPMKVYVGGGDGALLAGALAEFEPALWPAMTLEGIRLSAEHV